MTWHHICGSDRGKTREDEGIKIVSSIFKFLNLNIITGNLRKD
jgi:hypothetical protein